MNSEPLIHILVFVLIFSAYAESLESETTVRVPCGKKSLQQCSFVDRFTFFRNALWEKSSGYDNGPPFASFWAGTNSFVNTKLKSLGLAITNRLNPESGLRYASGEVKSKGRYGYGCYEARMRPIAKPGAITAFFIYTDKFNALKGRPKRVNSVNLGFLYQPQLKTMSYRMTYTTNGQPGPIQDVYPRFDISKSFHNYGFKFTANKITWYLDGNVVFEATKNIPKESSGPFRIFLNTWVVNPAAGFGGKFVFKGRGVTRIAAVRYTAVVIAHKISFM